MGRKGERLDIGTYPATGLKEAREEVIRLRGELESNRNPRLVKQAEKRKATEAMMVESVIRAWYEAYCVKNKKGSEQIPARLSCTCSLKSGISLTMQLHCMIG